MQIESHVLWPALTPCILLPPWAQSVRACSTLLAALFSLFFSLKVLSVQNSLVAWELLIWQSIQLMTPPDHIQHSLGFLIWNSSLLRRLLEHSRHLLETFIFKVHTHSEPPISSCYHLGVYISKIQPTPRSASVMLSLRRTHMLEKPGGGHDGQSIKQVDVFHFCRDKAGTFWQRLVV